MGIIRSIIRFVLIKNDRLAKRLDACVAGMQRALDAGDFERFAELDAAAENIDDWEVVYDIDRPDCVKDGDPYSCAKDRLDRFRKGYTAMPKREGMPPATQDIVSSVRRGINSIDSWLASMRSCLAMGDIEGFKKLDKIFEEGYIRDARKYGMLNMFPSGLLSELESLRAEVAERFNQSSSEQQNGNGSGTWFNGNCPKCAKYFTVLRLKPDAGETETKNAHRNFAKICHPDRFEGKSEKQTAEEELKQINEAYSHIIDHFKPKRS
jgi:DnaJ domain